MSVAENIQKSVEFMKSIYCSLDLFFGIHGIFHPDFDLIPNQIQFVMFPTSFRKNVPKIQCKRCLYCLHMVYDQLQYVTKHVTLILLNLNIRAVSCFESSVDPDQLANNQLIMFSTPQMKYWGGV